MEQKDITKSGFYNSKQLLISTIIGGPAIAGFIIGCNLWSRKRPRLAIIPAFLGVPLGFILILPVFLIAHYIRSYSLRQVIGISLLFLFQAGFAYLLNWYLKKKDNKGIFNFSEFDEKIHHRRMFFPIIIISIIYFITYLAFSFYTWAVLAFYLFPHFYAYIHIYKTFGNEKIAKPFLWSIVLLACLLPFVTTTGEISYVISSKANLFYTYLHLLIGFYVVFVFYSVLFILGLNILLLINWIFGLLSIKTLTNRIAVLVTMLIAISFALVITIIGSYINNHPVVNKYSITLPKKSTTLNTLNNVSSI